MLSSPGMLINTAQDHTPAAARLFQVSIYAVSQHNLSTRMSPVLSTFGFSG